ncbi:MAG: hypothetical protein DMF60_18460 [Acidobacteria bacterium]|nr:MAG: hypothetical protein DMF60_18460 [Acidobacteriota bacterium]
MFGSSPADVDHREQPAIKLVGDQKDLTMWWPEDSAGRPRAPGVTSGRHGPRDTPPRVVSAALFKIAGEAQPSAILLS